QSKLLDWIPFRDHYLDELIRQDGYCPLPAHQGRCASCWKTAEAKGEYRCTDCTSDRLLCGQCIVAEHQQLPLHRLEYWNGSFFKKVSLLSLGFCLFLGHEGHCCPTPYTTSLLVGDTSGFHSVKVAFCRCYHRGTHIPVYMQLLGIRWYPATPNNPTTAFTFNLLDTYHELSLQGNTNIYDFTIAIEHRTDNTGLNSPKTRYRQLALVVRQWRFLKMLKRGGRGHDPAGVDATQPGALAIECPACPRPGVNLPDDWESAPPDQSWLYEQVFAVDANFRLKLKDRNLRDLELAPGWAYYVEETAYQHHLKNHEDVPEPKYCDSQHSAVAKAATLKTIGYSVSGVGAVVCGRHSMVRKNAVADLQKGERYVTMDYIILSTLANTSHRRLTISYDIACQWSRNFAKRVPHFPEAMRLDLSKVSLRAAVPKFHIAAHGPKCQGEFNLNYMDRTGRTYGEGVESGWSYTNGLATSTREMGPGGRHENLNDHWGAWNWRKVIGFGAYFQKGLREALLWQAKSAAQFQSSSATFPESTTEKWCKMVEDWELNKKKRDPYAEPSYSITTADVRLQLANEEAQATARGDTPAHSMSPSIFIQTGLDLEDQQYLRVIELKGTLTSYEKADLQEKRNSLARRIEAWRVVQDIYMPFVAALRAIATSSPRDDDGADHSVALEKAEELDLFLPSSLPPTHRCLGTTNGLSRIETRLRIAQADDALAEVRMHRRVTQGLADFKKLQVSGTGQAPNTRVRSLFAQVGARTLRSAERYRDARQALTALDPGGDWSTRMHILRADDIRGPHREEDERSEGRHEVSWIWLAPRQGPRDDNDESTEEFGEAMRVEWVKARARARRWEEEVVYVQEEMRRVLQTLESDARLWLSRRALREDVGEELRSGLTAYAAKQAAIRLDLAKSFAIMWIPTLRAFNLDPPWADKY
ncbi:hypothetical protein FA95DRAFT_1465725, partial [Auriscalpium vulgare]